MIFWKFFNYKSFLANFFQINREFATVYFSFKLFFTKWRKLATKSKSLTRMFWKLTSKCMCRILGNLHVMHVLMNVMQLTLCKFTCNVWNAKHNFNTHNCSLSVVFPPFILHFQLELYACKGTRHAYSHKYAKLGFQLSVRIYSKVWM